MTRSWPASVLMITDFCPLTEENTQVNCTAVVRAHCCTSDPMVGCSQGLQLMWQIVFSVAAGAYHVYGSGDTSWPSSMDSTPAGPADAVRGPFCAVRFGVASDDDSSIHVVCLTGNLEVLGYGHECAHISVTVIRASLSVTRLWLKRCAAQVYAPAAQPLPPAAGYATEGEAQARTLLLLCCPYVCLLQAASRQSIHVSMMAPTQV